MRTSRVVTRSILALAWILCVSAVGDEPVASGEISPTLWTALEVDALRAVSADLGEADEAPTAVRLFAAELDGRPPAEAVVHLYRYPGPGAAEEHLVTYGISQEAPRSVGEDAFRRLQLIRTAIEWPNQSHVAALDLDGDGRQEVVVFGLSDPDDGRPSVLQVFTGREGVDLVDRCENPTPGAGYWLIDEEGDGTKEFLALHHRDDETRTVDASVIRRHPDGIYRRDPDPASDALLLGILGGLGAYDRHPPELGVPPRERLARALEARGLSAREDASILGRAQTGDEADP